MIEPPSRVMHALAALSLIAAGVTGVQPDDSGEENEKAMVAHERPEETPTPTVTPPAPRTPATGAHKRAKVAERYKVRPGDTLSTIAEAQLGDVDKWPNLYGANLKAVGPDPDALTPGATLTIAEGKAPALKRAEGNGRHRAVPEPTEVRAYANNLDGWIREALGVMSSNGIPGTYNSIHRNVMRESGGNPHAVNNWDSNAMAGTPSKGLLQTIEPTFRAYHVPGTSWDVFDPVANIAAACNYAAHNYGSIDNVNGAY
ncbi:transglycosylase SLT domain-containing protein [Streptomyces sp. NPDC094144]|uniref:transglycosylase SLT domain-containing protein n=1 Tax=Streptomyces sp. NPDC094144 TaxID=3366056 RepID=UPI0038175BD8